MQNLVVFKQQTESAAEDAINLKGGNMYFNRFCIDEDDGFELFGFVNLKKIYFGPFFDKTEAKIKAKGTEFHAN